MAILTPWLYYVATRLTYTVTTTAACFDLDRSSDIAGDSTGRILHQSAHHMGHQRLDLKDTLTDVSASQAELAG